MMGVEILYFFQRIANPILDFLANFASLLGEQVPLIVIILIVYYGFSKTKGCALFSSLAFALITTNSLKAIVRAPRPWVTNPELLSQRLDTATGYSFPSGHTTGATSFYPALGRVFKLKSVLIIGLIIALMTALSRNYLLVHWPIDVIVGLCIGLVFSLALSTIFEKLYLDNSKFFIFSGITLFIISLFITIDLNFFNSDIKAFKDLLHISALASGGFLAINYEKKYVNFLVCKKPLNLIANTLICLLGIVLLILAEDLLSIYIGYFSYLFTMPLVGFWAIGLYPQIAIKLKLLTK